MAAHPTSRHLLFALLALFLFVPAAPRPAAAIGAIGDAYVTGEGSGLVRAYGGATGAFLGVAASSQAGATAQAAIHFGATNGRYLVGHQAGGVNEFDAATNAYVRTYGTGGGWMWSAIYLPNGNVLVASTSTNELVEYDGVTGALVAVRATLPGDPADMRFGPNGHLYVCTYFHSTLYELDPSTYGILHSWTSQFGWFNDVAILPNGDVLVTGSDIMAGLGTLQRFDAAGSAIGLVTGLSRPHGIDIRPSDGHVFVADGAAAEVREFDPVTLAELNPAWCSPSPADKIVDIEFRRDDRATWLSPTTWGRLKSLYR